MRRLISFVSLTILVAGCSSVPAFDGTSDSELNEGEGVEVGTRLRVTATLLNLREGPSMEHRILGAPLEQGTIVTCIETSGEEGWVRVQTEDGRKGWVHTAYVTRADNPSGLPPRSGATCEPSRAQGAVPQVHKAFHDMIAFAEGTRGKSKDGYDVMFGGGSFASCARHPDQCIAFGNTCSTAAGRYQFLTKTWNSSARALGLADFEPESQELGTAYLIKTARRVNLPADRPLTSAEFANALSKLSYEWASLPPNRYGQPNRTKEELWQVYCEGAGCR